MTSNKVSPVLGGTYFSRLKLYITLGLVMPRSRNVKAQKEELTVGITAHPHHGRRTEARGSDTRPAVKRPSGGKMYLQGSRQGGTALAASCFESSRRSALCDTPRLCGEASTKCAFQAGPPCW